MIRIFRKLYHIITQINLKLWSNMIVAIVILCLFYVFHNFGPGQRLMDSVYDEFVTSYYKNIVNAQVSPEEGIEISEEDLVDQRIQLVVFSEEQYKQQPFGYLWTSRYTLAEVIIRAVSQGAKLVMVDFGFESIVPPYSVDSNSDENHYLLANLEKAGSTARELGSRILYPEISFELLVPLSTYHQQYLEELQRILLRDYQDVFYPCSPGISYDSDDGKVREFRFISPSVPSGQKKAPERHISFPAVAALILHGSDIVDNKEDEQAETLNSLLSALKKSLIEERSKTHEVMDVSGKTLFTATTQPHSLHTKLVFRLAPDDIARDMSSGGADSNGEQKFSNILGRNVTDVDTFLKEKKGLTGQAVLIGADAIQMGDHHRTAIGTIAGIYILANALDMLLKSRQFVEHSFWWTLMIRVIILLSMALLFFFCKNLVGEKWLIFSFFAFLVSFLVFIVPELLVVSERGFKYCYDIAAGAVIWGLYGLILDIEGAFNISLVGKTED